MVLTYNAIIAIVNVTMLLVLSRNRSTRGLVWGVLTSATVTILLTGLGYTVFDQARLAGWGGFVHAPCALVGAALIMRTSHRRSSGLLFSLGVLFAATGVHAFHVEPYRLELTRVRIVSPKLETQLRIAVLADIQTDDVGTHERRALKWVMDESPDLILFLGDYVQSEDPQRADQVEADLNRALREAALEAPLGVHAVGGNTDVGRDWTRVFDGVNVQLHWQTTSLQAGPVALTALSEWDSFDADLRVESTEQFHVAFGHYPDFALGDVQADLLLAGHTHGGQVRLPFIGALVTFSKIPRAWAAGLTVLEDERTLIVSRGVGMERDDAPQLRFLCRPEVLIIDVVPK